MKVLFLTSTLPRFAGDMQPDFVGEQARAWKTARPGDEVIILAPHDPAAAMAEKRDGVEVIRFKYMRPERWQTLAYPAILPNIKRRPWLAAQVAPFILSQFLAARKIVKQRGIDLVYAHWVMPQGLVAWWLKRDCGTPFAVQNHSSDLAIFGKLGAPGRSLARRILRACEHFFCVNPGQRGEALSLFTIEERMAFAVKASVIPMGVGQPPEATADGSYEIDFGSISRLSRKKGLNHFIAAAEMLAEKGVRPKIAIGGDGEDAVAIKSLVRKADVSFPGFLSGEDKDAFFEQTRAFVLASVATGGDVEGLPVSLLEALCRGKITVASRDTNIMTLPEWPNIQHDVIYLEDPTDIPAFANALEQAMKMDESAVARLRHEMRRYWWPNLIGDYLAPLGLQKTA